MENNRFTFHVHFPENVEKIGRPVILGDGTSWRNPVVNLRQPFPQNPSYWQSDPITFSLSNIVGKNDIQYKYAILIESNGKVETVYDGQDIRILDTTKNDQFGIWKNNLNLGQKLIVNPMIYDFAFVNCIYNSINSNNFKNKVMEYQYLLVHYKDLTIHVSNLKFIFDHADDKLREKRLFLSLLLGYYIQRQQEHYELASYFPSGLLLNAFEQENLPSNTKDQMYTAITTLVQHNAFQMQFEWLIIFTIVDKIDPNYTFIDRLRTLKYPNDNLLSKLINEVKPYVDIVGLKSETYVKFAKWLIELCHNMDFLFQLWSDVFFHNDAFDKSILKCFIDQVQKNIYHDDAVDLEDHFKRLPKSYQDDVSGTFRNHVTFLLENPNRRWTNENIAAIKRLLHDDNLNWRGEEFVQSLEFISQSNTLKLLDIFPEVLDYWFRGDFSNIKENRIPKICITWFKNLLLKLDAITGNRKSPNESNLILLVFEQLELMHPLFGQRINIWQSLTDIAIERVKGCSETQIFAATKLIVQIKPVDVKKIFLDTIKEILSETVQQANDQLLDKIFIICDCKDKKILVIPNPMCEDILCHIMIRLQSQFATPSPSEHHLNILKSSSFWNIILRTTGSVTGLNLNQFVKYVKASINELAGLFLEKTIDVQLLQQLLKYSDEKLFQHFTLGDVIVSKDEIVKLRKLCDNYVIQLDILFKFYNGFCSATQVTDVNDYIQDVKHLQNSNKVKLEQVLLPNYWAFHEKTLESAKRCYKFNQSKTFRNIFEDCIQKDPAATKVEYMTQTLMPIVFERYNTICNQFKEWKKLKCSDASLFWNDVTDVNAELELMEDYESKGKKFLQTIDHLSKIPHRIGQLENLEKVAETFKVPHNKDDWLSKSIRTLKDDSMLLGQINQSFDNLDRYLSNANRDCWILIKVLSSAEELIVFLKESAEHDIKNWISYAGDHSDEIQADTISSLIQVKKFLFPLMNNNIETISGVLNELLLIIKKNPTLVEKIILCNSNNMALQDMYNDIQNRGEVTKEKIKNAVLNGTFIFARDQKEEECLVSLQYSCVKYNLHEILNLRGQALLIAKAKNTAVINDNDRKVMDQFIAQVDIAQEAINIVSMLMQMGHVDYRKFEIKLQGTDKMKNYLNFLKEELDKWHGIVDRAQEGCYYLTFFPARHILAFYDYFTSEKLDKENEEECKTLVRFVNCKAQLPSHKDVQGILRGSKDYFEVFCKIGNKLDKIFRNIPKQLRKLKAAEQHVTSNIVTKGKLFVATYTDKTQVPNVIISLYSNQGYYPESWQLLTCTPSTTMEELAIFTKRSFFGPNNGYENHLFCIANLELLDFELQHNFVNYIKTMQLKYDNENYLLALLCCRKPGMSNYILDQYSLEVQEINGVDVGIMREIYQEICPNTICVFSDLPGQGKTEWINEARSSKPYSFLINDSMDLKYLVNKLRKCNLKNIQSLHINILSADYPEDVNLFLFELLTFKMVSYNKMIVSIPETFIFIEIASSVKQNLLRYLPIIRCLPFKHLSWDIKNFKVSQEIASPVQIVCQFLKSYDLGKIDTEEIFIQTSSKSIKDPLSEEFCQNLIMKYFLNGSSKNILSFRYIEIFINVLADQLIRFSSSQCFSINNLELKYKKVNIRSAIVKSLIDISKDFAIKSIKTRAAQFKSLTSGYEDESVKFDNSNHNLLFFNSQTSDSFTILYHDKNKVPVYFKLLLKDQAGKLKNWKFDDLNTMIANELLMKLEKIARRSKEKLELPEYALSSDNMIKMALILLRVRAKVPVVICGETGCGKTSLIAYLALIVEVQFQALNLYAGIDEIAIITFMNDALKKAEKGEIWLFFDEINTCNHLGLFADLISRRMLNGKLIHPNIRLFSACNPYRLRQIKAVLTNKINNHERSNLVYQVKPLPDQILDYVWDYGVLKPQDELKYIQIIVEKELKKLAHPVFADLLFASQKFIRKVEKPYSVSLRDIKRAITLVKFFYNSLENRPKRNEYPLPGNPTTMIRSYILALGLCYHSRLYEQDLRKQYRCEMGQILQNHQVDVEEDTFAKIIREEQEDYINRMICPPNTAKNEALLENVLVMIVCILTRIPLFLIGAPDSSKTLAIRLISSNLHGSDSNDEYFRSLPQVYLIPYQDSSVSTPDSIIKVFDKANKYQKTNSALFPVTSVVLLDFGLAETSSLKVLHSLLEPSYPFTEPTVSVIGMSNWRLDISKSSRALLVQRPQFDLEDLVDTAEHLYKNVLPGQRGFLESLAKVYLDYEKHGQALPNFHGLRDYYSLVKRISLEMSPKNVQMELARNFGGTKNNAELCKKYFGDVLKTFNNNSPCPYKPIPTEQLIDSNLNDTDARHLMVIGKRDSIIKLLAYRLRRKNPVVILGSQFPDDQENYLYSVLGRIIMCIETGRTLILTDLEMIYGSLNDLWDQNYIIVKNKGNTKYYTRIALGAYANSMICVSPSFRCIIVMDEKNLVSVGPPLFKFEKQKMPTNVTLNDRQKSLVEKLDIWTRRMSTFFEAQSCNGFTLKDLFIGFDYEETLQSLVINITKNNLEVEDNEILEKCKECLIAIATSDGVIRAELSNLEQSEVDRWKNIYFNQQHHDSLCNYFSALFNREQSLTDSKGHLVIVNTFSKVNTDIKPYLQDSLRCQVHNLSVFRTEAQFSNLVKYFFFESTDQILILQCNITAINAKCINLAKYIIEEFRNEFLVKKEQLEPMKHACIILHIQRDCESNLISSNFICGWERTIIESLEPPEIPLIKFLDQPLYNIINSGPFVNLFEKILQDKLSCYLSHIDNEICKNHISALNRKVLNNSNSVQYIKAKAFEWISENCKNWQYEVALNKKNLSKFTCFSLALQDYVKLITEQTIAKILYSFENLSEISTFFNNDNIAGSEMKKELSDLWKQFFMDNVINNLNNLPELRPIVTSLMINSDPFSFYFQINYYNNYYYEELDILKQNSESINHYNKLVEDHIEDFRDNLISINQNFENLQKYSELYYNDFIRIILSTYSIKLTSKEKLDFILKYLTGDKTIVNDPFLLHVYWWKCAEEILIQLKLVETFPNIITKAQKDFIVYGKLDQYLFRESINLILQNICDDKPWKQDMDIISTINDKINDPKKFSNLQLLFTCNDLLKINSVPLEKIREIISLGKSVKKQEFIPAEIINLVFIGLDNDNDIIPIRSFIARSLKLISLESEERLILYRNLFSRNPFKLVGSIIEKIFATEVQQNKQILLTLIKNSEEALQISIRLNTVNDSIKSIDSDMSELCCEIIQRIFNRFESNELLPYFKHSIESFVKQEGLLLQQITSIAFLKEIIHKFWKNFVQGDKSLSKLVLKEINDNQSIQSYFALYLYQRSSMEQFEMFKKEFSWLEDFDSVNYLPKLLKSTRRINFEDFRTFYNSNLQNLEKHPFLSVFFKHCERLKHIKYLYPIIRFVKILNPKLEYHLTRKAAQIMTFHEFIKKESADEDEYANLKSIFEEFAFGWNSIINYIELKELSLNKPFMDLELPVIFGLIEQSDAGVYLCAILEFLIKLHNEFLDSVMAIPVGTCNSLKFLEELFWNNLTPKTYFIASKKVSQAQHVNFISYEWNDKILNYSQRDLEIKEDTNFIFDLQKIESKLAKKLVLNKVYFEMEDNQSYLKKFSFKHEIFHNFPRILFNIKKVLPQSPIPADKLLIILAKFQPSLILNSSSNSINLSELIILFEMILCFIKELPIKNSNILISDFVNQWLKLARYNITFIDIFKEFSLQHTVALYELIEEQIANSIIHNIDDKFKVPLTQQMKDSINNVVDYYDLEYQNQQLISAKAFAIALKRFIYRFLLIDSNIENLSLNLYLLDFTLDLWTSDVKVKELFPTCLLVSHAYNSYVLIVDEIEKATNEKQTNNNFTSTSSSTTRRTLIKKFKKF